MQTIGKRTKELVSHPDVTRAVRRLIQHEEQASKKDDGSSDHQGEKSEAVTVDGETLIVRRMRPS